MNALVAAPALITDAPRVAHVGTATLVLGDAKRLSQEFAGRADLILSDPPYKLTSGGKPKPDDPKFKRMSGIFKHDVYDNSGLLMSVPSWAEIAGVITALAGPNAEAYVMANDKNVFDAQAALASHRWKLHNLLAWDTLHPKPNRWYMKHLEFVLYMWQGKARSIHNKGDKQLMPARRALGEDKVHPTQKPLLLLSRYVQNSTNPGDLVMDPYAGSGSTLIAAALAGRHAIGFEVDEKNFEAAVLNMQKHIQDAPGIK